MNAARFLSDFGASLLPTKRSAILKDKGFINLPDASEYFCLAPSFVDQRSGVGAFLLLFTLNLFKCSIPTTDRIAVLTLGGPFPG